MSKADEVGSTVVTPIGSDDDEAMDFLQRLVGDEAPGQPGPVGEEFVMSVLTTQPTAATVCLGNGGAGSTTSVTVRSCTPSPPSSIDDDAADDTFASKVGSPSVAVAALHLSDFPAHAPAADALPPPARLPRAMAWPIKPPDSANPQALPRAHAYFPHAAAAAHPMQHGPVLRTSAAMALPPSQAPTRAPMPLVHAQPMPSHSLPLAAAAPRAQWHSLVVDREPSHHASTTTQVDLCAAPASTPQNPTACVQSLRDGSTALQAPPAPPPARLLVAGCAALGTCAPAWAADSEISLGGGSGRNLAERKDWSAEEDMAICRGVARHGSKWRVIAAEVGGRSDDAVRNRWNRIKHLPGACGLKVDPSEAELVPTTASKGGGIGDSKGRANKASKSRSGGAGGSAGGEGSIDLGGEAEEKPDRVSWSRKEDEMIARSVSELGNKWHRIAERLPGRTEHAIRNRYARLQALASRGKPIVLTSGKGIPLGISLVPHNAVTLKRE